MLDTAQTMAQYRVGTSGYNHKEWRGSFYPHDLPDADQFRYYAARFATVELNYTFYKPPSVRLLQGWAKEAPEQFAFALKAPRAITHDLRLRDAADAVADFSATVRALKAKLGPVLFQLPQFLKRDVPRLEDFLHQMPPGFRVAFEFRNPSWFDDEVYECLRRFGVAICTVDGPERVTAWEATGDFGYFRLRQPDYSDADLAVCAERIAGVAAQWRDAFVYFKQEAAGRGPQLAAKLQALLESPRAPVAAQL